MAIQLELGLILSYIETRYRSVAINHDASSPLLNQIPAATLGGDREDLGTLTAK
jgi:hypothetical protein